MTIQSYNNFPSLEQMTDMLGKNSLRVGSGTGIGNQNSGKVNDKQSVSFEQVFKQKTEEKTALKFSKHANERMMQRNLELSQKQMERLENGVQKAGEKGIKESLVMVDDLAFIVNVDNSTVITAVDENDSRVFTNIDGAVIA